MDEDLNKLLLNLDNEIERKCYQIKEKKKDEKATKLFMLVAFLFLTIPFLFVFMGINILIVCFPVMLFLMISTIILSPIILRI